jgi:hypothetical protein
MLAACTPQPEPAPKPTKTQLFSSDAEAFKAAEETYRAYTDALNKVDTSDPRTFEAVYSYETGDLKALDKKNLSTLRAEQLTVTGDTVIRGFEGVSTSAGFKEVIGSVCLDVSQTDIRDKTGASVVPPGRLDIYTAIVTFTSVDGALLASHIEADEKNPCAS